MPDFLLELLSEEIPARMQPRARDDLARLFEAEIAKAGLKAESIETFSTPRRLALIARNLPDQTDAVRDELKGPRTSAPPQALEGFLRKTGLTQDQLTERDGVWYAVIDKPGRATASVLAETIPAIVRAFPWPKSMRWGAASISTESLRWVRPLHGIVALLGGEIVPFEIDGIESGAETVGHRFHHPGRITIGGADDYAAKLRACHVIVDHEEREGVIATGATTVAAQAGLTLVRDEALLRENAGLTEWPVPLLGSFDPSFLEVPPEVIQLTMATNQKYFALKSSPAFAGEGDHAKHGGGAERSDVSKPPLRSGPSTAFGGPPPQAELGEELNLAPAFICTANVEPRDAGAAIVAGNRKVLAARLSDAKFFWEQDLRVPLEDQAKKLDQIVFHEKLGTVADKVARVAKLARWLCEEGIIKPLPFRGGVGVGPVDGTGAGRLGGTDSPHPNPSPEGEGLSLADMAEQAARLCKADLVTGMVGEFPELQGIMGGYYARAQGHPDAVADAIRDHYKPVGQGDDVPTAPVTVAVSLADKLDALCSFFSIDERPSGSRDPFALRRAALGVLRLNQENDLRFDIHDAAAAWAGNRYDDLSISLAMLTNFMVDRLLVQQREAGLRHDFVKASEKWGTALDSRPDRILRRGNSLQAFIQTAEGADLLAGYKRAANILKKEGWATTTSAPAKAGAQEGAVRSDSGLLPSQEHEGEVQGIPQTGEEDPFVMAEDLRDAIVGHEKLLSYTPEPEESSLLAALDSAEPRARAAVAAEDFEGAMAALATLRAPVDAFFEKVTVNDPDPAKRAARLNLLARMRDAVHQVADFSRIEG